MIFTLTLNTFFGCFFRDGIIECFNLVVIIERKRGFTISVLTPDRLVTHDTITLHCSGYVSNSRDP